MLVVAFVGRRQADQAHKPDPSNPKVRYYEIRADILLGLIG
jgi:hypothetical protein